MDGIGIGVDFFFQVDNGKRFLYIKVKDVRCDMPQFSNLFTEVAESVITTSYENICIDLSSMSLVTSMVFGVCINLVSLAKQRGKKLKFRFTADAMETAKLAAFDELVELEQA
jgi:ABC-type transporter Mla MlaB component